jgi:hypothetical protein
VSYISNCLVAELLRRNQNGCVFVFEQEHHELGRLCLARVVTDGVNVVGTFIKGLPGREGYGLSPFTPMTMLPSST